MQRINYKGFNIDIGDKDQIFQTLINCLQTNGCKQVLTLNPEFIVKAGKNVGLINLNNSCELVIVDGFGLAWALKKYAKKILRYPGVDIMHDLCAYAEKHNLKVGIFLSANGLSSEDEIRQAFLKLFPQIQIYIFYQNETTIQDINNQNLSLLFLTLGQTMQENWIFENKNALNCKIAIGVGGAVDFITGARKRAPRFFRQLGLEWLWRLITHPKRLKRIWNATFGFWHTISFKL
ncbi:MAG: WecB/TagA/CpsF family glycosyltransferase [Patescibacteria group bacterium]|jgi:N-acetylglucosaminyldiphosphoundecaprenol N-acetyl-beta-D-mannosaminyltransferase